MKMPNFPSRWLLLLATFISLNGVSQSTEITSVIEEVEKLRAFWGLDVYANDKTIRENLKNLKIGIITKGFSGLRDGGKRFLPKNAEFMFTDDKVLFRTDKTLGRQVAQLVWGLTGYEEEGPQMRLFDGTTPGAMDEAMESMRSWRPDVVLNTENLEGYGNFDGKGPFNAKVEAFIKTTGAVWSQSVGSYRYNTYDGPVKFTQKGGEKWVTFSYSNLSALPLWVKSNKANVKVTLSWNSYGRGIRGKGKDLDLFIYPSRGHNEPAAEPLKLDGGTLKQVTESSENEKETVFSIEQIFINSSQLPRSEHGYFIVVKHKGGEFTEQEDSLRITIETDKEPYIDKEGCYFFPVQLALFNETDQCMVPSDSPYVIAVGENSPWSSIGPIPLILDWIRIPFSDGTALKQGPHISAAIVASTALLLKAANPDFESRHLKKWLKKMQEERNANQIELKSPSRGLRIYSDGGWQLDFKSFELNSAINGVRPNDFPKELKEEILVWSRLGHVSYGLRKRFVDLAYFNNLDQKVKQSPEKYRVFVCHTDKQNYQFYFFHRNDIEAKLPYDEYAQFTQNSCVEFEELTEILDSRDYTKGKALRWRTPSTSELKSLVAGD